LRLLLCHHKIDKDGRVIDLERNKAKLKIIEQEFQTAERTEHWRQKEEEDMRVSFYPFVRACLSRRSTF